MCSASSFRVGPLMGKPAGNPYAFSYSSTYISTFLTPHFLISLFLKGRFLLQIESSVYGLTGLKSRWREINLFVYFSIFRRLSNNLSFPQMDRQFVFHRNIVRWKAKYPLIFMTSMTVFLTERRGTTEKLLMYLIKTPTLINKKHLIPQY